MDVCAHGDQRARICEGLACQWGGGGGRILLEVRCGAHGGPREVGGAGGKDLRSPHTPWSKGRPKALPSPTSWFICL